MYLQVKIKLFAYHIVKLIALNKGEHIYFFLIFQYLSLAKTSISLRTQ